MWQSLGVGAGAETERCPATSSYVCCTILGVEAQVTREGLLSMSGAERKLGSRLGHHLSYPDRAVDRDISHYDASAGCGNRKVPG